MYKIYNDDCLKKLDEFEENSIDCIVTDPPYELGFMGKSWDSLGISFKKETWQKCLRVLKPGGFLLAFGGSRTSHRIACAIEDAGFEIRDTIIYLYGSGFPKSMNIGLAVDKKRGVESRVVGKGKSGNADTHTRTMNSKTTSGKDVFGGEYQIKEAQNEWQGWGTCLKPSYEPIIVARKPFKGSLVDNVLEYGVGGLNIDECRVGEEVIQGGTMPDFRDIGKKSRESIGVDKLSFGQVRDAKRKPLEAHVGRFPANTILDESVAETMPEGSHTGHRTQQSVANCIAKHKNRKGKTQCDVGGNISKITEYTDTSSVSRYFYCAKASKRDRDEGVEMGHNDHPTVKSTSLMQYLVRLVAPKGATILDPFCGSGSTGKAIAYENKERNADYKFIGIEQDKHYCEIAKERIGYAEQDNEN